MRCQLACLSQLSTQWGRRWLLVHDTSILYVNPDTGNLLLHSSYVSFLTQICNLLVHDTSINPVICNSLIPSSSLWILSQDYCTYDTSILFSNSDTTTFILMLILTYLTLHQLYYKDLIRFLYKIYCHFQLWIKLNPNINCINCSQELYWQKLNKW